MFYKPTPNFARNLSMEMHLYFQSALIGDSFFYILLCMSHVDNWCFLNLIVKHLNCIYMHIVRIFWVMLFFHS